MIRNILIILFALFFINKSNATTSIHDSVMSVFMQQYNAGKFEAIFSTFNENMQSSLPLDKTKQFFSSLQFQLGKINIYHFGYKENDQTVVYKTVFEKAELGIHLAIDNQYKIGGLLIQPYNEPSNSILLQTNTLSFPTEIIGALQQQCKDLPQKTEIAIALINNNAVTFYGVEIGNNQLIEKNNAISVFEIGSITKVFTTTLLAQLVRDQKIQLRDTINTYFPYVFHKNTILTFESLANHTAGLPRLPSNLPLLDLQNPYTNYGYDKLDYYLQHLIKIPANQPRVSEYSNLGSAILGYALALSQQSTIPVLFKSKIFDKYGMANTYTNFEHIPNLVKGLDANGNETSYWNMNAFLPAGGILSTVADLSKFLLAHLDNNNAVNKLTQTITYDKETKVGLGWHIVPTNDGGQAFWHNGGTGGFSSSMVFSPTTQTGVIVLSNVSGFHDKMENIDKLCFQLMKSLQP